MADDYYKTLGLSKSASADDIQKAYRKLARKYHPDLHADKDDKAKDKAKQNFQKVQQAYDVLSDAKKRQMYDQYGPKFAQMGGGGPNPFGGGSSPFGQGGVDFSQIFGGAGGGGGFEEILRGMGGGGRQSRGRGQRGRGRAAGPKKGDNIEEDITVPFSVMVLGGEHQVSFERRGGKVERVKVKVPAGIEHGKKIRLRGQGASGIDGGARGDLMIRVNVAAHPYYTRSGLNLNVVLPITLNEAVAGAKIDLPTPHGTVTVTVPPGSQGGKSLRMKGLGIKTADRKGDLMAHLQIMLPESLSDEDRQAIRKLEARWEGAGPRDGLVW